MKKILIGLVGLLLNVTSYAAQAPNYRQLYIIIGNLSGIMDAGVTVSHFQASFVGDNADVLNQNFQIGLPTAVAPKGMSAMTVTLQNTHTVAKTSGTLDISLASSTDTLANGCEFQVPVVFQNDSATGLYAFQIAGPATIIHESSLSSPYLCDEPEFPQGAVGHEASNIHVESR